MSDERGMIVPEPGHRRVGDGVCAVDSWPWPAAFTCSCYRTAEQLRRSVPVLNARLAEE